MRLHLSARDRQSEARASGALDSLVMLFTATPVNCGARDLVAIVDLLGADNVDNEVLDVLGRLIGRRGNLNETMSASERDLLQRAI